MSAYDILMQRANALQSVQDSLADKLISRAEAVKTRQREVAAEIEANKNSWATRLELDPDSKLGAAVNLSASFASGAARVGGQVAALPAYIGSIHDSSQLNDTHYQAYDRYQRGVATKEDMSLLQSNIYDDGRPDTPNFLQAIQSSENKRQLGRDITERFNIEGIVHQGNRTALTKDLRSGFGDNWEQVKSGLEGTDGKGITDVASGLGKLMYNAGKAAINNPLGVSEYVVENIPQLALGMFGKAGVSALSASNVGYAANEYQKGIEKFQKENNGAMPSVEQRQEMAMWASSLALAEQVGDISLLKGIGKLAGTSDDAVKTGFKAALKAGAATVAKSTGSEALTEGYQTYAEGKASLEEKTAEDIYIGAAIGGMAGGGMTAVAPVLAAPSAYKAARKEAGIQAEKAAAEQALVTKAVADRNPDFFLDKESQHFNPTTALGVLHTLSNQEGIAPEKRAEYASKASEIITGFEAELEPLKVELAKSEQTKATLAEVEAELATFAPGTVDHTDRTELVKLLKDQLAADAQMGYQAKAAKLEEHISSANKVYEQLTTEQVIADTKDVDAVALVTTATQDIDPAKPEIAAQVSASVNKLRVLSMVSPEKVTVEQAKAIINSANISQADKHYFEQYVNAQSAVDKAMTLPAVSEEIMNGDSSKNQKGLQQYRAKFGAAMRVNNTKAADKEIDGLSNFIVNQQGKVAALEKARDIFKSTGVRQHVAKDADGVWQINDIPTGVKPVREVGEYIIFGNPKTLLIAANAELNAMNKTMEFMTKVREGNVPTQSVPPTITASNTGTATSVQATPVAQPGSDTGALGSTATVDATGQSQQATSATQPTNASTSSAPTQTTQPTATVSEATTATQTNQEAALNAGNVATTDGVSTESGQPANVEANGIKEEKPEAKRDVLNTEATKALEQVVLSLEVVNDTLSDEAIAELEEFNNARLKQETNNETTNTTESSTTKDGRGQTEIVAQETVSEALEGSNGQPEANQGTGEGEQEVITPEIGVLSIFEDTHPHTKTIRDNLFQNAGKNNGTKRPLVMVKNFLSLLASNIQVANEFLKAPMTAVQSAALQTFVEEAKGANETIQSLLARSSSSDYYWKNITEFFMTSDIETRSVLDLDENMKTAMTAAAFSYVMDSFGNGLFNTEKRAKGILNLGDADTLEDHQYKALLFKGTRRNMAADAIGQKIIQSLGIKAKNTAPANMLPKLAASLGTYALFMLEKEGLVETTTISASEWYWIVTDRGNYDNLSAEVKKTYLPQPFVRLTRDPKNEGRAAPQVKALVDTFKGTQSILDKLFDVESGDKLPSFEKVPFKQEKVKKGRTSIPSLIKKTLIKKNAEEHFLRITMFDLVTALSPERFLAIGGARTVDDNMHVNNRISQEATNEGLERNYWNNREFVETFWSEEGLETPIFFQHNVWPQQRVGISNSVLNPQTDKMARHILTKNSWRTAVDPSNPDSLNNFKLRVLEGFGVKTDKQRNLKSLKEWDAKINTKEVQAAVDAIVFLRTNRGTPLTEAQQEAIANVAVNAGEKYRSLDSLNALADWKMAGESSFETEIVGEVDGVTNGPILTNLFLAASATKAELLARINKGGFFAVGQGFQNYNVFRGMDGVQDLYETTIGAVLDNIRPYKDSPKLQHIWAFTGELEDGGGKVVKAGRNLIKRPITALHYGSSVSKGVEGMANDFVNSVFTTLEKAHKDGKDVTPLIRSLNYMLDLKGKDRIPESTTSAEMLNYKLDDGDINNLREYFTFMLGEVIQETLKEEFGTLLNKKQVLTNTARYAFGIFNAINQATRTEYLNKLVAEGKVQTNKLGQPIWGLSPVQEAAVEVLVGKARPMMATAGSILSEEPGSGLSVSKSEKSFSGDSVLYGSVVNLNPKANIGGKNQKTATTSASSTIESGPGVSALSFSVHSADSAISHIAAILSEALNIHDAHVLGVGQFIQGAKSLNEATWKVLLNYSPMQAVYESLENTLNAAVAILSDPKTSPAVRNAVLSYFNQELKEHNDKKIKHNRHIFVGTGMDFFVHNLEMAKAVAYHSDLMRLEVLSLLEFLDQYALEEGQYDVTPEDRAEALEKRAALTPQVSQEVRASLNKLREMATATPVTGSEVLSGVQMRESRASGYAQRTEHTADAAGAMVAIAEANEYINHSGGAVGADSMFDTVGREFGFNNHNHYWHGRQTPQGNVQLNDAQVNEGIEHAKKAAAVLNRPWNNRFASLLGRNWFQVKNATQVIAIAPLIAPGERNSKGFVSKAARTTVDGGTGYAVEMAIANGKELHVFDTKTNQWFSWNGKQFVKSSVPTLAKNYAGIGSRQDDGKMTPESIQAIRDVFQKTSESVSTFGTTPVFEPSFDEYDPLVLNDTKAANTLKVIAESKDVPEHILEAAKHVMSMMEETGMTFNEALSGTLEPHEESDLVSFMASVNRAAQSSPFGVLGDPVIQPEADVVALMEANPSMTGKDLVQKLYGVLQARGTAPQTEFYKQLLKMTMKALGDVQVKYVTPATAASEVTAKPDKASRGWYVSDGTLYVLSPDFVVSGLTTEMLIHELVHAAITEMLNNPTTTEQKQAVEELNTLLDKAKEYVASNKLTNYNEAVANLDEMVAWGMSNAGFQKDVLRQLKITSKTKLQVIADGLQSFVNNLIKLVFPKSKGTESNRIDGFSALLGNVALMYASAAKAQKGQIKQSVNRLLSMSWVDPNQVIENYTTEQVFDALPGSPSYADRLKGVLSDIVGVHGAFGAIKARVEKQVGKTALDAWANAQARGERPFAGKVLTAKVKFTDQEAYVAEQVEAVMGAVLSDKAAANSVLYKELEKVYVQAKDVLKGKIDADLYKFLFQAQAGMGGKSDYMQRFVALALSHEVFNKSLQFETHKTALMFKGKTFMQRLETVWRAAVDFISAKVAGTYLGQRADHRIEVLARKLSQVEAKNKDRVKSNLSPFDFLHPMEEKAKNAVESIKNTTYKAANSKFVRENRFMVVKAAGQIAKPILANDRVAKIVDGLNEMANKTKDGRPNEAVQLLNYIKGPSQWLSHVIRMAKKVEGERKHTINDVSKAVLAAFKDNGNYLTDEHKAAISTTLLRTGVHVLMDKFKVSGIQAMFENKGLLNSAIQTEINQLSAHPEVHYWVAQAKGLAWKQVTGWAGVARQNLNAHNIAHLYNTGRPSPASAKGGIPNIERLIALYGMQYSDGSKVSSLLQVMKTESARGSENGIEATLKMYVHLADESKEKLFKGSEPMYMHGYLPEVHDPRVAMEIARTQEEAKELKDRGFNLVTLVPVDKNDPDQRPVMLFAVNGAGLARWQSGAFSTSGTNARGKQKHNQFFNSNDPVGVVNMQSMNHIYAEEQAEVDKQFVSNPGFTPKLENRLIPIVNANGKMVDYRYTMKEYLRDDLLKRDNRFEYLLGVMAGNTYDKVASREQNKQLAEVLHTTFKKDFGSKPSNFVLIGTDSKDPEMKEIWGLMPSNTRRDVEHIWGTKGMWVPKEMVVPLFGYRKASLATIFDKENRNFAEKTFVEFATFMTRTYGGVWKNKLKGNEADEYAKRTQLYVRKAEDMWAEVVSEMKDTIVIKTVTVLWGNMTSNSSVLIANGLSPMAAFNYQLEGLRAVMDYTNHRNELAELNLRLVMASGINNEDALRGRIVELEDAIARNPAKELIDAGMLPTIVEDINMEDNPYSYKTNLVEWADKKTAWVNPHVLGASKQVYMAHHTVVYQFLSKSTQYSDFVSRYALYKHETTKKNPTSKDEAMFLASETFVNYDIPLPKTLQYLDDHGILMFTKYFLSIQRVLVKLFRDKPLSVINMIAMNNFLFDMPIVTDSMVLRRIGNNPASMGAFGYPFVLDDLATVAVPFGIFK